MASSKAPTRPCHTTAEARICCQSRYTLLVLLPLFLLPLLPWQEPLDKLCQLQHNFVISLGEAITSKALTAAAADGASILVGQLAADRDNLLQQLAQTRGCWSTCVSAAADAVTECGLDAAAQLFSILQDRRQLLQRVCGMRPADVLQLLRVAGEGLTDEATQRQLLQS